MSFPIKPGIRITIGLTAEDWQMISRGVDYALSRARDLQEEGRLPYPKEDDVEALWAMRILSRVRIREGVEFCVIPSERTSDSSAYDNYGEPAHYIAKPDKKILSEQKGEGDEI